MTQLAAASTAACALATARDVRQVVRHIAEREDRLAPDPVPRRQLGDRGGLAAPPAAALMRPGCRTAPDRPAADRRVQEGHGLVG